MLHSTSRTAATRWASSARRLMAALLALTIALLVAPAPTHAATNLFFGPTQAAFTAQPLNTTSPIFRVTVFNNSGFRAQIGTIAVTGPFALTNNCPLYLSVFAQCSIDITFRPTTAGLHTGVVTRNGVAAASLRGEGFAPVPEIKEVVAKLDVLEDWSESQIPQDDLKHVKEGANNPDFLGKLDAANDVTVYDGLIVRNESILTGIASDISKLKGMIDTLSNDQQMDMLRLQSLTSKRNEAYDQVSAFVKKLADSRANILANMR